VLIMALAAGQLDGMVHIGRMHGQLSVGMRRASLICWRNVLDVFVSQDLVVLHLLGRWLTGSMCRRSFIVVIIVKAEYL
jgi:hypothetical protein